jgi:hypothetical protein
VDVPLAIAPELTQRLTNYALDEHARVLLRRLSPLVEPLIGPAIDQVIAGAVKLPEVADLWQCHGAEMRRIEIEQFRTLLAATPPTLRGATLRPKRKPRLASKAGPEFAAHSSCKQHPI